MSNSSQSLDFHKIHNDEYTRIIGGASVRISQFMVQDIFPVITPESYILDNACGPAIVTSVIKEQEPKAKIIAADLTQGMLDQRVDMRDLKGLKDGSFSHSFTCLGIQALTAAEEGPLQACKELYRVAQPGGVCVVACWLERTFPHVMMAAARRVRPSEEPTNKMAMPAGWETGSWLLKLMEDAGFGHQTMTKPCPTYNEAQNIGMLAKNLMTFKSYFFPEYSDEELDKTKQLVEEELLKVPGFVVENDGRVKLPMLAVVGYGWK